MRKYVSKIVPIAMAAIMAVTAVPYPVLASSAAVITVEESSPEVEEYDMEEPTGSIQSVELGEEKITFEAGKTYIVPATLMNGSNISQASMAAGCLGKYAALTVDENGNVTVSVDVRSVTIGAVTSYGSDFQIYQEGIGSEKIPADILGTTSVTGVDGTRKEVPAGIAFNLPAARLTASGLYISMFVDAMQYAPDAYILMDYAAARVSGDSTYNYTKQGTARVEQFGEYDVTADVTVTNGKISDVTVEGNNFQGNFASKNKIYLSSAISGMKEQFVGLYDTDSDQVNQADTVSGATYSSNAIKAAVANALGIEQKEEILEPAPSEIAAGTYTVDIANTSETVAHSLVEDNRTQAVLRVTDDKSMTLSYRMTSGTVKEPLYILGVNGYYEANDRTKALTAEGLRYVTEAAGDYTVVTDITMPLGTLDTTYYNNVYLYVPAMSNLNGTLDGVEFENGKFNIDSRITVYWDTLKSSGDQPYLSDGIYAVDGQMMKVDKTTPSMSNSAIDHTIMLKVENGAALVQMDFHYLVVTSLTGYLKDLKYYTDGYTQDKWGNPQTGDAASLEDVTVLSCQKYTDGTKVADSLGTDYPDHIQFPLVNQAYNDGLVPLQVFVPIMESISAGTGTQPIYLTLDWTSLRKTTADDPTFTDEDKQEEKEIPVTIVTPSPTVTPGPVDTTTPAPGNANVSAKPTLTKVKGLKAVNKRKKQVKLTWKKTAGASGYVIYRSTKKKSGYKKLATVKKRNTVCYTNRKLKKGKTYYYKIRAYCTVNGRKVYGPYSKTIKVKVKK